MPRPKAVNVANTIQENVVVQAVADLDTVYNDAASEKNSLTLLPSHKAAFNHTVEVYEPLIERNGMTVCKRK